MKLWMIYDREGMERNASYIQMYRERCRTYEIQVEPVLAETLSCRLQDDEMPVCALVRIICPEINQIRGGRWNILRTRCCRCPL